MPVEIIISNEDIDGNGVVDDIDALSRLVKAEALNMVSVLQGQGLTLSEARNEAFGSVIDTVINRAASNSTVWRRKAQNSCGCL